MIFKQLKQYRGSLSLVLMIIITGITQVLTLMKSSLVAGIFGTLIIWLIVSFHFYLDL